MCKKLHDINFFVLPQCKHITFSKVKYNSQSCICAGKMIMGMGRKYFWEVFRSVYLYLKKDKIKYVY